MILQMRSVNVDIVLLGAELNPFYVFLHLNTAVKSDISNDKSVYTRRIIILE